MQVAMRESLGPQEFWQAVQERDPRFRNVFVYGVRSTGIYCRATCPSRRPRREQVDFFAGPEAAESAGFRACRRCRPQELSLRDPQAALVQKLCRYIDEHVDASIGLAELSAQAGLSEFHLQRMFKRVLGIAPKQYVEARRLLLLKSRLKSGDDVTTAVYAAGYGSSSRVYGRSSSHLGMTPASYRSGAPGTTIRYITLDTDHGRLLVAATDRGVCAVRFGDGDDELRSDLQKEFPMATVTHGGDEIGELARGVLAGIAGKPHPDIPLDIACTAFQAKVWKELRRIPRGQTRSYAQVAEAIGDPKATRAVARACATNPVALVVPCHRVVHSNGELGGYRWGPERKQQLLRAESGR